MIWTITFLLLAYLISNKYIFYWKNVFWDLQNAYIACLEGIIYFPNTIFKAQKWIARLFFNNTQ